MKSTGTPATGVRSRSVFLDGEDIDIDAERAAFAISLGDSGGTISVGAGGDAAAVLVT